MVDKLKLVVAVALVAAGVWGYYWLADQALVLRVLAVVAGLLAGAAVAWFSTQGRPIAAGVPAKARINR